MVPHSSEFRHEKRSSDGIDEKTVRETHDRKNSEAISEVMSEENTRKALDKNKMMEKKVQNSALYFQELNSKSQSNLLMFT
jgi:hypothetical protein